MNEKEFWFNAVGVVLVFILSFAIGGVIAGCATRPTTTGDESLVENRIIAAVNAERNRWATDLSRELTEEVGEIDRRTGAVAGGLQQVEFAAREYRQLTLRTIDQLQKLADEVRTGIRVDDTPDSDTGSVDRRQSAEGYCRI